MADTKPPRTLTYAAPEEHGDTMADQEPIVFANTAGIMNEFNTGLEPDIVITRLDILEVKANVKTFGWDAQQIAENIILPGMSGSRSFNAVRDLYR